MPPACRRADVPSAPRLVSGHDRRRRVTGSIRAVGRGRSRRETAVARLVRRNPAGISTPRGARERGYPPVRRRCVWPEGSGRPAHFGAPRLTGRSVHPEDRRIGEEPPRTAAAVRGPVGPGPRSRAYAAVGATAPQPPAARGARCPPGPGRSRRPGRRLRNSTSQRPGKVLRSRPRPGRAGRHRCPVAIHRLRIGVGGMVWHARAGRPFGDLGRGPERRADFVRARGAWRRPARNRGVALSSARGRPRSAVRSNGRTAVATPHSDRGTGLARARSRRR